MITAILFFGIPLLIVLAVIALGVWFFFRRQRVETKPLILTSDEDKGSTNQQQPTVNPSPTPQANNIQQKITWGQWDQEKWSDEKLTAMGLGRCVQLRKLNPKNNALIEAAIIIKAYGLTTPYGTELDETAIDYGVYGGGTYGISFAIGLNAQENWKKIQTGLELNKLTVEVLKANDKVDFNHPDHKEVNKDTFTEKAQNATIDCETFQKTTMKLFMQKLADNGKFSFLSILHADLNTTYTTLCSKISKLSLPSYLSLSLTRLQAAQTKNPIVPTLAINQLFGFLVYQKNHGIEFAEIQEFLTTYQISQADENFLSQLYRTWDRKDKLLFIEQTLSQSMPKKIIDTIKFDPDPKEILGHLLFLAHNTNEITPDAVNNCVLAFNQTFYANLSALTLYQAHANKVSSPIPNRSDFFVNFVIDRVKNDYLANKKLGETTVFISQLRGKLSSSMKALNWEKMKHLDLPTIFNIMIEQINLSHSSNPSFPTLNKILNNVFEKFEKNQHKINDEIGGNLNNIALIIENALGVGIDGKEKKIFNALTALDTQLTAQQVEPIKRDEKASTATTTQKLH